MCEDGRGSDVELESAVDPASEDRGLLASGVCDPVLGRLVIASSTLLYVKSEEMRTSSSNRRTVRIPLV